MSRRYFSRWQVTVSLLLLLVAIPSWLMAQSSGSGETASQDSLDQQIESLGLNIADPEVPAVASPASTDTNQVAVPATPTGQPEVAQAVSGQVTAAVIAPVQPVDNQIRVLLRPRSTTLLSTEASGQVRSMPFDIGDNFGKGDTLVKLKCSDTYSEIAIAKARVNQSQIEYESNRSLLTQGGVSRFDVDLSGAKVEETKAVLNKYQVAAGDCNLKAPYGGKVVARLVEQFEYVGSGQQVLEIIDDSKLNMQLYVPSAWVTRLGKDSEFKVYIDEVDKEYDARVIRVNPRVDAGSKTLELVAQFNEQHDELKAGMSGNATFDL